MTVAELKRFLDKLPPDAKVTCDCHEAYYDYRSEDNRLEISFGYDGDCCFIDDVVVYSKE